MSGTRIPQKISDFHDYMNTTDNYNLAGGPPTTNGSRLGLSSGEISDWTTYRNSDNSLYDLWKEKLVSRTLQVSQDYKIMRKDFRAFAKPLLNRIASSSNVTADDMNKYNIKAGVLADTTPTVAQTATEKMCSPSFKNLGGGSFKLNVKVVGTTGRSGIPRSENVDGIEFAFMLGEPYTPGHTENGTPIPAIGTVPPASQEDTRLQRATRTKAIEQFNLGGDAKGMDLYVFLRYHNSKKEDTMSGPWSTLFTFSIPKN